MFSTKRLFLILGFLILLGLAFWFTQQKHLWPAKPVPETVYLLPQPVYKVKKHYELLDIQIMRITSNQQPEEFLVLGHVPTGMVNSVYGKAQVDLSWANSMATQFFKLRETLGDAEAATVEIQRVKTLRKATIPYAGRQVPYWEVLIQFQVNNEPEPRYYQAGVLRDLRPGQDRGFETLLVAYAQKGTYQKELVNDVLKTLSFERP